MSEPDPFAAPSPAWPPPTVDGAGTGAPRMGGGTKVALFAGVALVAVALGIGASVAVLSRDDDADVRTEMIARLQAVLDMTEAEAECVVDDLDGSTDLTDLARSIDDDVVTSAASAAIIDAWDSCTGALDGLAGDGSYGDDAALDALWDGCAAGDMTSCDDLYRESPFGSEYEVFGDTCGGRSDNGGLCARRSSDGTEDVGD